MKFNFGPQSRPLDGFTIKRPIQKGGFGEVYFAETDAGKEVALKLLQHNLEIELRGVRQCLNLKHPNLVSIHDIKQDADGDHWIVMEFVHGRTLIDILHDHPRGLPVEEVARWIEHMAAGLDFLHDRGIVHRDMKPANIFDDDGIVKIGDVGLSKFITESRRGGQTQSVGTVYYMAPEVSRGQYNKELDIYSLGVMAYEMLTGQLPFDGETSGEILMKHLTELPDLTKIPVKFRSAIAGALEKDPAKRTQRAGQFWNDFRAAMRNGAPVDNVRPVAPEQERLRQEVQKAHSDGSQAVRSTPAAESTRPEPISPVETVTGWLYQHRKQLLWGGLLLLILAPGFVLSALQPVIRLAIVAGAMAVLCVFIYRVYAYIRDQETIRREQLEIERRFAAESSAVPETKPVVAVPVKPAKRRQLTPETLRVIPFSQRMAELFSSLSLATFLTAAVAALLHVVTSDHLPYWQSAAAYGFCTLIPVWVILAECKILEGRKVDPLWRRVRMGVLGAGCGAAIYQLLSLLSPTLNHNGTPLLNSYGVEDFAVYFAVLFGLRSWWWRVDSARDVRMSVWSLFGTFLLSLLIPLFVDFPTVWSEMWAVSIAAVVQLSAVWIPPEERRRTLQQQSIEMRA